VSASTPQEIATRAGESLWARDKAAQHLGMELVAIGPGTATLALTVTDVMTNGHDLAHGGYIYTLADTAFAYGCNSYGLVTVAAQCSISYIRPGYKGDRLVATAREVSRTARSGIYDIQVTARGKVIAEFRGHSRTIGGSFVEGLPDPEA
jgi:acyl-CoA thioesterase